MSLQDFYSEALQNNNFFDCTDTWWIAGTFTPSVAYSITSVKLWMSRYNSPGIVTVSIQDTNVSTGKPNGNDLCVGTIDGDTLTDENLDGFNPTFEEITFPTPATLTAGTVYAIVIRPLDGGHSDNANVYEGANATYAGGAVYWTTDSGSTWSIQIVDLIFETYGDEIMAMTDYAIEIVTPPIEGGWIYSSQYTADVDDCFDLVALTAGKSHYIRKIIMNCGTITATFTLGSTVSSNALVHTYIGPISFGVAGGMFVLDFGEKAMKLESGHSFAIDGSNATPVYIYFEYKTV